MGRGRLMLPDNIDRQQNLEPAAASEFTFGAYRAAHAVNQLFGDRKPETGAPVGSGRRTIRLNERFEDLIKAVSRDAGPCVFDTER